MEADEIRNVLSNLEKLPYRTILVEGPWGIGKSYEVEAALRDRKHTYALSLFGMHTGQDIYRDLYFKIKGWDDSGILFKAVRAGKQVMRASEAGASVDEAIEQLANPKNSVISSLKEQEKSVVVIDDIERKSPNVCMREFLGIVEELKQRTGCIIIMIANGEEMDEEDRTVFQKYGEKIIDREFHITEQAADIKWEDLKIDRGFIEKFLKLHRVKNLRTLQKAERFCQDVFAYKGELSDPAFEEEIRQICYAIVSESVEGLYEDETKESEHDDTVQKTIKHLSQNFLYRIKRCYLVGMRASDELVSSIYQHYTNESQISCQILKKQYEKFCQRDERIPFYKSEEEIRQMLPEFRRAMEEAQEMGSFLGTAKDSLVWNKILGNDCTEILGAFRKRIGELIQKKIREGHYFWNGTFEAPNLREKELIEICEEEYRKEGRKYVQALIDEILQNIQQKDFKEGFEQSRVLRNMMSIREYRDYLSECSSTLLNQKILPVGSITEEQYFLSYSLLQILYKLKKDELEEMIAQHMGELDCVSKFRIEYVLKEIANS